MKKLKAAIVGCGRISVSYADAFHRLSDEVELAYAVDKDPALAKAFAEEFNCSWPTFFSGIARISRQRYIATCLGITILELRLFPQRSAVLTLKCSATIEIM